MSRKTNLAGSIGTFSKGEANNIKIAYPSKYSRYPVIFSYLNKNFPSWVRALKGAGKHKTNRI